MRKFLMLLCVLILLTGCAMPRTSSTESQNCMSNNVIQGVASNEEGVFGIPKKTESLELMYAEQFRVDFYEGGYVHISVNDGTDYVIVPQNEDDNDLGLDAPVYIHMPCERIYLAATSAMDLFIELDSLDSIAACSTQAKDYAMEAAREAIASDQIEYVGKYNAPDYEALLRNNCSLAVESTMIGHTPKTKEQLETLGIPVLVERSSYEAEPLGRLEWIKLYGLLVGKYDAAEEFFEEQVAKLSAITGVTAENNQDKTEVVKIAFFSVSSTGYITVRKPGDYICKMIEMAGGEYALNGLAVEEDNALSTINIGMEDFYREAIDADILIYNGTIDGGINSVSDLLKKSDLFKDFKAVKNQKVWSTGLNMFQESSKCVDVIYEMSKLVNGDEEELYYLKHLE